MSTLSRLTNDFLNRCLKEFDNKNNKDKVQRVIIDPIIDEINNKLFPYLIVTFVLYILILIPLIIILIVILAKKSKQT